MSLLVRAVCGDIGLDEERTSQVELGTVEAVTNAIKHAYEGKPGREVSLIFTLHESRLEIDIVDQGLGMPEKFQQRLRDGSDALKFDPLDLAGVPEGGMGLEIIHQTMDAAEYSAEPGGNRLRLTKLLRRGAGA